MNGILYSPQGRAISIVISTFGSGILCSAIVSNITREDNLAWNKIYVYEEFWIAIIFVIVLTLYYIGMYKRDIEISTTLSDYNDEDILIAMARKQQMKELTKWSKQQARLGNLDQLHSLDQFLKGEYRNEANSNDRRSNDKSK